MPKKSTPKKSTPKKLNLNIERIAVSASSRSIDVKWQQTIQQLDTIISHENIKKLTKGRKVTPVLL